MRAYPFLNMESTVKQGYDCKKQTEVCNTVRLSYDVPSNYMPDEKQPREGRLLYCRGIPLPKSSRSLHL